MRIKQSRGTEDAHALVQRVIQHNYNPPRRERILEWQQEQEFPICPMSDDSAACNVCRELRFPDDIYDNISNFYEGQTERQQNGYDGHSH